MPVGEGANLGTASGRIVIDTSDLNNVRVATQQVGQDAERNLGRVGASARRAQGSLRDLAGAFGVAAGAAGAAQFARFAINADAVATVYRRQSVAALQLAGSQRNLNELLEAYHRATGNTIDDAQALSDVTRIQAVGLANTAEELERLLEGVRGAALSRGVPTDFIITRLQFELLNQTGLRLDELGLSMQEVQRRQEELLATSQGMSKEAAYQEAVITALNEKYGGLARSAAGAKTGMELLRREAKNARLAFGQLGGPFIDFVASGIGMWIHDAIRDTRFLIDNVHELGQSFGIFSRAVPRPNLTSPAIESFRQQEMRGGVAAGPRFDREERTLIRERFDALNEVTREANQARIDATRQYEEQRTNTIRDYERNIAREAEDFGRQRLRAEEEFQRSIADVREDAARREARQIEDFERAIGQARENTAERIAELREDTNERLLELDENYARQRERAERQHRDNLLSAASRLDARAVAEEQRRFRRQQEDAEEAFDDQRSDIQEQLQERIQDEEKALEKSNRQRREALERQLAEQRENDERRIRDMREDFERQKRIEDEDRAIRLTRMAQDHQDRLAEMERQHRIDLAQITRQAQETRREVEDEFNAALNEVGLATDQWIATNKRLTDAAIEDFTRFFDVVNEQFAERQQGGQGASLRPLLRYQEGGPVRQTGPAILHAGEFVLSRQMMSQGAGPGGMTVNIAVNGGGDGRSIAVAIRHEMENLFRSLS